MNAHQIDGIRNFQSKKEPITIENIKGDEKINFNDKLKKAFHIKNVKR